MKITKELDLVNFEFWSGAKDHEFTHSELKNLEYDFEEMFYEGLTETEVNDMFWFEEEFLCECLGIDYAEYQNR